MSSSTRVLHVYRTYFPDTQGGIEEVIRQICLNTQSYGIESRIFTLGANLEPVVLKRKEAEIHRFHRSFEVASCGVSFRSLDGFKRLVDWADVIHYQFPWPFADFLHFAGNVNKPTLVTYQSDIIRQQSLLTLYRPLMRAFLDSVDLIVPTSQNYVSSSEELGRYADKIEVVPNGLDDAIYPEVQGKELVSARGQFGDDYFLFIGVLRYYKGLHILLDALQGASLKCVIAGSGPFESELKRHAARLGLDNVYFLGHVSDIEKVVLLQLCRAVVFPSHLRSEAFGMTLVEGAMFGRPLISAEIGTGASYVNDDGKTGYVVPPEDPLALREAMEKLYKDKLLAERLGAAARNRYELEFTGRLMGERYANLYERLLENSMSEY
ncbi:MAG: glycosyltransferase [Sedimenticola sp.]